MQTSTSGEMCGGSFLDPLDHVGGPYATEAFELRCGNGCRTLKIAEKRGRNIPLFFRHSSKRMQGLIYISTTVEAATIRAISCTYP